MKKNYQSSGQISSNDLFSASTPKKNAIIPAKIIIIAANFIKKNYLFYI
jgi:hypothetical protein